MASTIAGALVPQGSLDFCGFSGTASVGDVIYMISPTKAVLINVSAAAPDVVIIQQ